jgi:hypothetical protein
MEYGVGSMELGGKNLYFSVRDFTSYFLLPTSVASGKK